MVSVRVTQVRDSEATMLWQVNRPGHLPIEAAALSMPDLLAIACHYGKVQHLGPMRLERRLSAMQAFAKLVMARMRAAPRKARECTEKGQGGKLQVLRPAEDDVSGDADVFYVLEGLF